MQSQLAGPLVDKEKAPPGNWWGFFFIHFFSGEYRSRTDDLLHAMQAL
jgi:hypothetical protein